MPSQHFNRRAQRGLAPQTGPLGVGARWGQAGLSGFTALGQLAIAFSRQAAGVLALLTLGMAQGVLAGANASCAALEPFGAARGLATAATVEGEGGVGLDGDRHPLPASDPGPAHRERSRRVGRGPRFLARARRQTPSRFSQGRRNALVALAAAPCLPVQASKLLNVTSFPDLDRSAKAAQGEWNRRNPQTPMKLVSRSYPDHHTAMSASLATRAGLPDVMALDLRFIGQFTAGGGLMNLAELAAADGTDLSRVPAFSLAQARTHRGELIAMPTDIGPGSLMYRQDLLQRAGLQERDLLHSWPEFLRAGLVIKRATGASLLSSAGDLLDIVLRSGLRDGDGLYFDRDGRPVVDSERFARAFELGLQARRSGLDLSLSAWSNEWAAAFRQGKVATQMMGCWLAGHLKNWLAPAQAGLWRAAPLPGGTVASYGGSFYAIPKGAANPQAAWAFVRQMVFEPATQLQSLSVIDAFPALLELHQHPVMDEPMPYLGGQRARQLWRDVASKVPATPVNKFDSLATRVMRDAFEQVLTQGRPIPAVLREANSLIRRRARR